MKKLAILLTLIPTISHAGIIPEGYKIKLTNDFYESCFNNMKPSLDNLHNNNIKISERTISDYCSCGANLFTKMVGKKFERNPKMSLEEFNDYTIDVIIPKIMKTCSSTISNK